MVDGCSIGGNFSIASANGIWAILVIAAGALVAPQIWVAVWCSKSSRATSLLLFLKKPFPLVQLLSIVLVTTTHNMSHIWTDRFVQHDVAAREGWREDGSEEEKYTTTGGRAGGSCCCRHQQ